MSKQYLQTHTLPLAKPADVFALATTKEHLLVASGSSSIDIYSTKRQTIHSDSEVDEHPYPLVQTLEKVHPLGVHHIAAVSIDGGSQIEGLVGVAASAGFGGEVKIWECIKSDIDSTAGVWKERGEIQADPKNNITHWALSLDPTGQYLAATTHSGRINVYDTHTTSSGKAKTIATYETKGSFGLAIDVSPNGNLTASGHQNGQIFIFNNTTQRLAHSVTGLIKPIRAVKFSPANAYLAAAGDARIIALYDTSSGEQVANLTGHASWIMSLDWNWSGEFLLSGSYDGKAKIWSLERRECVATQTEGEQCLWTVKWLWKAAGVRSESFVTAGAGRMLAFYREASGG